MKSADLGGRMIGNALIEIRLVTKGRFAGWILDLLEVAEVGATGGPRVFPSVPLPATELPPRSR
jgi:hypothetical protein